MGRSEENASDTDDDVERIQAAGLVAPPDGGWGLATVADAFVPRLGARRWMVVVGSFAANVIVDGFIFTAGQSFQPEWETEFGIGSAAAAWPISLVAAFYAISGPIVGGLTNSFGCRPVAAVGTLLAVAGFLVSLMSQGVFLLYISLGVVGGIGFGLVYLPAIVVVSYYFERRRALAVGLAACGSGIGTFVYAPMLTWLLKHYTWRQTLLIVAGIQLNGLACAALFLPLEPSAQQVDDMLDIAARRHPSVRLSDERLPEPDALPPPAHRDRAQTLEQSILRRRLLSRAATLKSQADLADSFVEINRPLSRMDIFYTASVHDVRDGRGGATRPSLTTTSTRNIQAALDATDDDAPTAAGWRADMLQVARQMLDVSLFRRPSFVILTVGGFLTVCGFFVPYVYLPRHAQLVGHSKVSATLLVSILGASNILTRIFCGWLSDHPLVDPLFVHNVAVTVGGVATVLVPFAHTYWLLCAYCVVFGFSGAVFASLRSIICVELLGLERLTNAFGFVLMFMGLAALVGSPLAGFLFDLTGDYYLSFHVTGALVTLSGLLGFTLKLVKRWEES